MNHVHELLKQGLARFDLDLPLDPWVLYLELLMKWNKAYNLTAIREPEHIITKHFFDSLALLPWLLGPRILDVGSGAGFPGIPLALARDDCYFTLLDSNGKKIRFLREVQRALGLHHVTVIQSRAEDHRPAKAYHTIMSRAVGDLPTLLSWTEHLVDPHGQWLLMKGHAPCDELSSITKPYRVETYGVAGIEGARSCIIINNQ